MLTASTRVRYGTRALIHLAKHQNKKPLALHTIAEDENISKKYLESIFHSLKNAGIIQSTRGPEGGYKLVKKPEQLTAREIVEAIDGPLTTVDCVTDPEYCKKMSQCGAHLLWEGLLKVNLNYLQKTSLADMVAKTTR